MTTRRMRLVEHIAHMTNAYSILVLKPERKTPLWIFRRRREYNIKINLEMGCE
jgi:hypothetical protein